MLCLGEFSRIFSKALFKSALISTLDSLEKGDGEKDKKKIAKSSLKI